MPHWRGNEFPMKARRVDGTKCDSHGCNGKTDNSRVRLNWDCPNPLGESACCFTIQHRSRGVCFQSNTMRRTHDLGPFSCYARLKARISRTAPCKAYIPCRQPPRMKLFVGHLCAKAGAEISSSIEITPNRTVPPIRNRQPSISSRPNDRCAVLPFAVTTMVEPWRT